MLKKLSVCLLSFSLLLSTVWLSVVAADTYDAEVAFTNQIVEDIGTLKATTKVASISRKQAKHLDNRLEMADHSMDKGIKDLGKNNTEKAAKKFKDAQKKITEYSRYLSEQVKKGGKSKKSRKSKKSNKGGIDEDVAAPLRDLATSIHIRLEQLIRGDIGNGAPVANAGSDQAANLGTSITLNGSASSDPDGDQITFQWNVVSEPSGSSAFLDNLSAVTPSFSPVIAGVYIIELVVSDNQLSSAADTVSVSVSAVNTQPVANAGVDQTGDIDDVVTLDGSASSDSDGHALSYRWALVSTPAESQASLESTNPSMPTFIPDLPGLYEIELIVNDGQLDSDTDLVRVNILTVNTKPIAQAGPDQGVFTNDLVTLDGSASSDVDRDPLSWFWSLTTLPDGSNAQLDYEMVVKPKFTADLAGQYVAQLIVNDGEDESDPDTVVINASMPNTIPLANAGADQSQVVGSPITLDGSASSDADSDPLAFNWSLVSIPATSTSSLDNDAIERPAFVLDVPGTYIAQLIVNDGRASSAPDETVVSTLNSRPVANAGVDQTITIGDIFQLDGSSSSDADGEALTYQWSISTQPTNSTASLLNTQIASPTFEADQIGVYVFQLIVNDASLSSVPVTQTLRVEPLETLTLTLNAPEDSLITNQSNIRFIGDLNQEASLTINGQPVILDLDLTFDHAVTLQEGINNFILSAVDTSNEEINLTRTITLDTAIPPTPNAGFISVGSPDLNDLVTIEGQVGSVEPFSEVVILNLRTYEITIVIADANGAFSVQVDGKQGDTYRLLSEDDAGNQSGAVEVDDGSVPDDPADAAPALSSTGSTPVFEATSFLYTGVNPIQTGVAADTIEASRAAVIRGKVMDQQNDPLSGVTVTVKDHPQYGQTITRSDGMFDLVVNGGGKLVVSYVKENYLPVQRGLTSRILDFQWVEDVVMIQLDSAVTTVNLLSTDPIQIARSSTQSDVDGSRTALLMFSQGTSANMIMPDGSTQALTSLDVRATEYTVGDAGPNAMPGPLPATSGYNYAVELSIDEAVAAGAKSVTFSQSVKFYLENFTGYNNGATIPVGYYDFEKAAWLGSKDGRIIQITAITGDLADIDIDGDDIADDDAALALLNIDIAERRQLAIEYPAGQSLWRVEVSHFSPYDCNWPYGPPVGSAPPPVVVTPELSVTNPENIDKECGCIIGASNQTLGEFEPVSGTDLNIFYQSKYSKGYAASRKINIPVTLETVPASLQSVQVDVYVAGTRTRMKFDNAPGQSYQYVWDGLDAYGREVLGAVNASVQIRYNYPIIRYETRPEITQSWATLGNSQIELGGGRNSGDFNTVANFGIVIGPGKAGVPNAGLGGWTLSNHHFFEATSGTLFLGTGDERKSDAIVPTLKYLGGGGIYSGTLYNADRLPSEMNFISHTDPVAAPDGGFYVADSGRILKIGRDNTQQSIAGDGTSISTHGINITGAELGDGGNASDASFRLSEGDGMGFDSSGNLYFASSSNGRIRKIDTNNIITTVSGDQSVRYEDSGNGGLAVDASLNSPRQLVVGPDDSLYFVDLIGNPYYGFSYTIRVIRPDGTIHRYAGGGSSVFGSNDASEARIQWVADMVIDSQGNLYIVEDFSSQIARRVRKITPSGVIETIAGGGPTEAYPGIRATEAAFPRNSSLAIDSQDRVYIATQFGSSAIYRIENGVLILVAGKVYDGPGDDQPPGVDGGLAFGDIGRISGMTFLSDETLMFNTTIFTGVGGFRIDRGWLFEIIPGLQDGVFDIASDDGVSVFQFDNDGKHLRTVNAVTGAAIDEFTYDEEGLLSSVEDAFGNVININRDTNGEPVGILSADGQVTGLSVGADGFLASVTNPLDDEIQMEYGPDGLLSQFTDKKSNVSTFTYDDLGLLTRDVNPAGGSWQLDRTVLEDDSTQVSMTTGEGRIKKYIQGKGGEDFQTFTVIESDGSRFTSLRGQNGSLIETFADGSVTTTKSGPDPVHGMQIPVNTSVTSVTPSGITSTSSQERVVTLTDEEDPFSISAITETGTTNGRTGTTSYDAITRTWTQTSPENRTATVQINAQGQPVLSEITGLNEASYSYDSRGRLQVITAGSGAEARVTTLTFYQSGSMEGYLESIEDAEQQITHFEYDALGRVEKQILPDLREIGYSYDANGNLASLTPPGRPAHVFNYKGVDQEELYTPPTVAGIATPQTVYTYNLDRQLTGVTRPDGQQITMNYGPTTGLLDGMTIPSGSYGYSYDVGSAQLTGITAPGNSTLSYGYDGFLLESTTLGGDVNGSVDRTYDNDFRIGSRSVNGASIVVFGYDEDSLLTQAGDLTIARELQKAGLIDGTTLGNLITDRGYNGFAEMDNFDASYSGVSLFNTAYTRDKLGRIKTKTETILGVATTTSYDYDPAGRLDSETPGGVTTSYTYDANGNRTHINGVLVGTYDDQDRLNTYQAVSYDYTDNGELLSKTEAGATTGYQYDVLGNLRQATLPGGLTIDYVIDGQNRRVGKKIDGVLTQGFLYKDQLNPIAELDGNNQVISRFVYGTKTSVPDYMVKGGVTYRIVSDHLGSPRLVVNIADGTVVQRMDYDSWGNVISDSNPGFQPFGFAGGIYDLHMELTRFGARGYDAHTARWTSKDSVSFNGGDTNLYRYAHGNPTNYKDPNGTNTVAAGGTIGFTVGGPGGAVIGAAIGAAIGIVGYIVYNEQASDNSDNPHPADPNPDRNPKADKKLTDKEAKKLPEHPHDLKDGDSTKDLFKDKKGNVFVKPKSGIGFGEPTGINVNECN
jgi:RHS repeat-associated protein